MSTFLYELWAHECTRVLSDRLISIEDNSVFEKLFFEIVEQEQIKAIDPTIFKVQNNLFNYFNNFDPNSIELVYD